MPHIASLISNPDNPVLTDAMLARVAAELPGAIPPVWLAPGIAAEIAFEGPHGPEVLGGARAALDRAPADLNFVAAQNRRKALFLADMDSTMIEQECIDELADLVGIRAHVAAITERVMRGELGFETSLRERVALLKGISLSAIQNLIRTRLTLTPGARTLVATLRAHGVHTALISGGFTLFTGPIAERIGFDEHRGNMLDLSGAALAGTVAEPILGRAAKCTVLIELREKLGLSSEQSLATGDGANDLDMLDEAGLGVAFHAKPVVAERAHARIEHGDLTGLLYLQGYRRDEFTVR